MINALQFQPDLKKLKKLWKTVCFLQFFTILIKSVWILAHQSYRLELMTNSNTFSNFPCNFVLFTPEGEWKVESKFNTRFGNLKGIGIKSSTVPIYVTPGLVLSHKRSFFLSIEKAATQNPPLKNNTRGDQRTVACPKNDLSSKLWNFKFDPYQ